MRQAEAKVAEAEVHRQRITRPDSLELRFVWTQADRTNADLKAHNATSAVQEAEDWQESNETSPQTQTFRSVGSLKATSTKMLVWPIGEVHTRFELAEAL